MAVSVSGIGRFLVFMGAAEPVAREIMAEVRTYAWDRGKAVDYTDAIQAMGLYGGTFARWLESDVSIVDRMEMLRDFVSEADCVVLSASLIAFLHQHGVRAKRARRIMRRAAHFNDGGVITTSTFEAYIPPDLMGAWCAFNGMPAEGLAMYTELPEADTHTDGGPGF